MYHGAWMGEPGNDRQLRPGLALYLLVLLAGLNFLNYATRNVVVTMYPELRAAFGYDNSQLGWLYSAFMLGHAATNVPFGWLADRYDRRRALATGAVIWSIANLASALAEPFGAMVASRFLAGVGTAACVPIANALLCDVFPEERKARTVAVLNVGLFLGGAAGIVMGTFPGLPWAFVILAVPGLLLAILTAGLPIAPRRSTVVAPITRSIEVVRVVKECFSVLRLRSMRRMLGGAVGASFAAGGFLAWFADFLDRAKGFDPESAMLILGGLGLTGGLAGVIAGGVVADRLRRTRENGRVLAICIGFAAATPCALVAIYAPRGATFYVGSWFLMFFVNWYHGPMAAAVDDLVDDNRAALAQATFIFLMHLLGTVPGPVLVGALTDVVTIQHALLVPTVGLVWAAIAFGTTRVAGRDGAREAC